MTKDIKQKVPFIAAYSAFTGVVAWTILGAICFGVYFLFKLKQTVYGLISVGSGCLFLIFAIAMLVSTVHWFFIGMQAILDGNKYH